jgi:transposase
MPHSKSLKNNIEKLNWPPQSPDMNPIENLCAIIKRQRQKKYRVPLTKDALIEQIFDIWDSIEPQLLDKLADSAINRLEAVLKV